MGLTDGVAASSSPAELAETIEQVLADGHVDQLLAFAREVDRRVPHVDRTEQPISLPRTDLTRAVHILAQDLTGLLVFLHIQARTEAEPAERMEREAEHVEDLQEVADREARGETGGIDPTEADPAPQQAQGSTEQQRPLSPAQHNALAFIARARARARAHAHVLVLVHESRIGKTKVDTGSSTRISVTTLNALETKGLVRRDRTTSLYHGQHLRLTPAGERALATDAPPPSAPAPPTPSPTASPRRPR